MDHFVPYLLFTQKVLSVSGLWKTQKYRQRLLRFYVIGFMALYTIVGESCQLISSNFDLRSAVRLLQVSVPTICGIGQYYNAVLHFNTIHKMYSFVLNDWQRLRDDTELKIMQKYADYGNIFTFSGLVMCYLYLIVSIFPPLLRIILSTNEIRSDLDLYPIISCFDYFSNRGTYYYPIVMYQIITSFILITVSIASYSVYVLFIQHVCARLSIIIYRIYFPFLHYNRIDDVPVAPIDFSPWIIDIVQCLAKTTEFMNMINAAFEKSYLFQISLGFVLLVLDLLCVPVLVEREAALKDVLGFLLFVSVSLFTIYLNCYLGQTVIDYSTDVYTEASLVPFHEMSLKTQKLLLTMLTICSKPYTISIGKVYVASHEFFSNLLRSSLSFAMMIHSLQTI